MCSSANPDEESLLQSQRAMTDTLDADYKTAFSQNQNVLAGLRTNLQDMIAHPKGFDPATEAAMRTSATDTNATQFANATRSANAYNSAHGGANLGSGVAAQINGQIAGTGAAIQSQNQNSITEANGQLQNENYWKGIAGLQGVANAYNPTGYANAASGSADATTNAANAVLSEQQAGWQNAMGVVNGIAGLASAGAGAYGDITTANKMKPQG